VSGGIIEGVGNWIAGRSGRDRNLWCLARPTVPTSRPPTGPFAKDNGGLLASPRRGTCFSAARPRTIGATDSIRDDRINELKPMAKLSEAEEMCTHATGLGGAPEAVYGFLASPPLASRSSAGL
jgi:hypothetical protein